MHLKLFHGALYCEKGYWFRLTARTTALPLDVWTEETDLLLIMNNSLITHEYGAQDSRSKADDKPLHPGAVTQCGRIQDLQW